MKLNVLPCCDVAPTAGVLSGKFGHQLKLLGGDCSCRQFDAHHLVGTTLALSIYAVVQTDDAEDIFFYLASKILGDCNFKSFDVCLLLFVQTSCLQNYWCDSHIFPLLARISATCLKVTNKVNFIGNSPNGQYFALIIGLGLGRSHASRRAVPCAACGSCRE